jgi:hypothetical protein
VGVSVPGTPHLLLAAHVGNCSQGAQRFTGLPPSQIYRVCALIQVVFQRIFLFQKSHPADLTYHATSLCRAKFQLANVVLAHNVKK